MHLKSLTVRGFKSFASATSLRFEPGITCVVGPNGSGKSNVVDAIAWVLGEQGAKALRGGKMEDVIFAGTAGRAPLGRAEVTLTIDNSDNALPIDYTEVSITRRMFRSGESEYELNGDSCRLLDIQELLSDSGIGREMHVIVGQGQLDGILSARPEDRRGFIEEAAGVLKHRKRKEKALRKLDAMQANLVRVTDLTAELRRQLKPLGRQAEVARRAATIQSDLRDARLRLLADDLTELTTTLRQEVADETAMRERRTQVEAELVVRTTEENDAETALAADAPELARAQDTYFRLSSVGERLRGLAQLAAERLRHLSEPLEDATTARDPDELDREAAGLEVELAELRRVLVAERANLAEAAARTQERSAQLARAEHELVAAARAAADRREGLATLTGRVNALRTRASAAADEITRIGGALAEARRRAAAARQEFDRVQQDVGALDSGELGLDERHEAAEAALAAAVAEVQTLGDRLRFAERDIASATARRDTLALGLNRKDGTAALLDAHERLPGLRGSLAASVQVEAGYEAAGAAALGAIADAVVLSSPGDAAVAIELLRSTDAGQAGMVVAGGDGPAVDRSTWPTAPTGTRWALDLVRAPDHLLPVLTRALDRVLVVPDLDAAARFATAHPGVRAVTRDGDLVGSDWAYGGSATAPSLIELQAALADAESVLAAGLTARERIGRAVESAVEGRVDAEAEVAVRLDALHESDARMSAVAQELGELGAAARGAGSEADRLERARQVAEEARDRDLEGLAELEERLRVAEAAPLEAEPSTDERDRLADEVVELRQHEVEVKLIVRTTEERLRAQQGRVEALTRAAVAERAARERLARRRAERAQGAAVADAVHRGATLAVERLAESLLAADRHRTEVAGSRGEREATLRVVRARIRELSADLDRLTDAVHRDEVARAEQRMRIDQVHERSAEEYGVAADALLAEYGPHVLVPPSPADALAAESAGTPEPQAAPYDRATQQKRAAKADRELALLGKVNPLALEEFAALEERHQFLSDQLEDLRNTRRDLLTVVADVDDRILEVFTAAYWDVAREFETVFATLFPGGEGRLVLTDPDNMLTTGIEVEARPPGKKVKRLSLLSGGERSLTAVAMLVAIFRARPSPFYIMDEVEAALDDVNLGRLLGLIEQLRGASQLIMITHQKRTMEIADALYGVTMRGDGITQVISQRIRSTEDGIVAPPVRDAEPEYV